MSQLHIVDRVFTPGSESSYLNYGSDFGKAMAISADGGTLAVGAQNYRNLGGVPEGAVFIYKAAGASYVYQSEIPMPPHTATNQGFGTSVSMSADGSKLVVGAWYWSGLTASHTGAAFLYVRSGNGYVLQHTFNRPSTVYGYYGSSVSITADGNHIFILPGNSNSCMAFSWVSNAWVQIPDVFCGGISTAILAESASSLLVGSIYTGTLKRLTGGNGVWDETTLITIAPSADHQSCRYFCKDAGGAIYVLDIYFNELAHLTRVYRLPAEGNFDPPFAPVSIQNDPNRVYGSVTGGVLIPPVSASGSESLLLGTFDPTTPWTSQGAIRVYKTNKIFWSGFDGTTEL